MERAYLTMQDLTICFHCISKNLKCRWVQTNFCIQNKQEAPNVFKTLKHNRWYSGC